MSSYAIVLIGVPARISDEVVNGLRNAFPTNHVILSDRSPQHKDGYALYDNSGVQRALLACATAVFGKTSRPYSFCRRPTQQCVLRAERKRHVDCGQSDNQACALEKPEYLLVLYQPSRDDSLLLRELAFSAYAKRLPLSCYGRAKQTLSTAEGIISNVKIRLKELEQWINHQKNTPLLLPIINFSTGSVLTLLKQVVRGLEISHQIKLFHDSGWDEANKGFLNPAKLVFRPTPASTAHGGRGAESTEKKALRTEYRLGCSYDIGFHYDVTHTIQNTLTGCSFRCSRNGDIICGSSDSYVNIYPDDFVRKGGG